MKTTYITLISFFIFTSVVKASEINGIQGPSYLITAWNLSKNDVVVHGHSRFYFKNEQLEKPVTFWDAQGSLNLFYGVGRNLEIGLSQIIYQDNHTDKKGYNLPDDLYFKMKFASFKPVQIPISFGMQIASRIPLAKYHNVPLEPYTSGDVEFSVMGVTSFSPNASHPEESFNFHLNGGYLNHNDSGVQTTANSSSSKEFLYGVALIYPIHAFQFSCEFYGNKLIKRPPPNYYSRYNYAYVTPGIVYHPTTWFALTLGFDYRITKAKPSASAQTISQGMPVYPTWRVNFGVKININAMAQKRQNSSMVKESKTDLAIEKGETNIYKQIASERKQIENAEQELQRIRAERKRMDEMLSRLKNILEGKEEDKDKKDDK